jgi:L-rhamnose mutarotase
MMQRIALHTRLVADAVDEYERLHAMIPAELDTALRDADVHGWHIWRDGPDLFHVVDVDDYRVMRDQLRDHPANIAWQARVGTLHEIADDYSGTDAGLPLVGDCHDEYWLRPIRGPVQPHWTRHGRTRQPLSTDR